jgi:hypothetical protein
MEATSLALDRLLCAVGDPIAELAGISPADAGFGEAQVIRAGAGVLAKTAESLPALARVIENTRGSALSPRLRAHLAAARAWSSGAPVVAAERYAGILNRWPHDLLALRLAQSCYFFLGWHDKVCAVVDAVRPAWRRGQPGYDFVLAMASFAHAESGDAAHAEALGRQALATNPACPLGVHAVAHAIAASGRHGSGAQWMRAQRAHWSGRSRMRAHNAWHLAMFDVEAGNVAPALAALDSWLLPASAGSPLDACDAAALLWRLSSAGIEDHDRWGRLSDAFERTMTPGFWPYVDLYAGLVHWTARKRARAQQLVGAIERCARGDDYAALRARHITRPALLAIGARGEGRYNEAARLLAGLRPVLAGAGGSRMQLEVFKSIEHELCSRRPGLPCDPPNLCAPPAAMPPAAVQTPA